MPEETVSPEVLAAVEAEAASENEATEPEVPAERRLLNTDEVAVLLNVPTHRVRSWISKEGLPVAERVKQQRGWPRPMFDVQEVEAWLGNRPGQGKRPENAAAPAKKQSRKVRVVEGRKKAGEELVGSPRDLREAIHREPEAYSFTAGVVPGPRPGGNPSMFAPVQHAERIRAAIAELEDAVRQAEALGCIVSLRLPEGEQDGSRVQARKRAS